MINEKLEDTRRRLLDLTRRNRLLNHKVKAAGTLRVVDEVPVEVYRVLVAEGQPMQFLSREEAPAEIILVGCLSPSPNVARGLDACPHPP